MRNKEPLKVSNLSINWHEYAELRKSSLPNISHREPIRPIVSMKEFGINSRRNSNKKDAMNRIGKALNMKGSKKSKSIHHRSW